HVLVAAGAPQKLSVNPVNPDGDTLTYTWRVDVANVGGSASTYVFRRDAAGTYRINVTASDGEAEVSTEWNATVTSSQGPAFIGPLLWVLVVAVAGIVVVILVLLRRRKRKTEAPGPPV